MGTPAMTTVYDEDGAEICTIYTQCDGYPREHGKELAEFLVGRKLVAGYGADSRGKISNGMEELAAQLLTELKCRYPRGHIYVVPHDKWAAEWEYRVWVNAEGQLQVRVTQDDEVQMKADTPEHFLHWCTVGGGKDL